MVEFLVRRHNVEMNKHFKGVENAAMKVLLNTRWKGNVRELDNAIEHAMIVGDSAWITVSDLPARIHQGRRNDPMTAGDDLKSAMRLYERDHLTNVLQRTEGDKRKAAELLGISLSSLYRKIEELELAEDPAVRA